MRENANDRLSESAVTYSGDILERDLDVLPVAWSEKDLISWLRTQDWKLSSLGEAPKSISRAERVLNKIKCRGDVRDILSCLTTVDMSLYIDELATVLADNCPCLDDDRRWYNSYIIIIANLIARYPQKFAGSWLAQVYRAEKRARDFLRCLITISLSNIYDFSKDIRSLLTRILDKSSNIHTYVQQRRSKLFSSITDTAVMAWEENQTFQFIESLYKNYSSDLFEMTVVTRGTIASHDVAREPRAGSNEVVDLLSISLISPRYKRGLHNMLIKYTRQRAIITLLLLYEVYNTQMEELQASRLRGFNDLEARQKVFARYIQGMEETIHFLLNEVALRHQDDASSYADIHSSTQSKMSAKETDSAIAKLTTAQSAPTLPVQEETGESVDSLELRVPEGTVANLLNSQAQERVTQHNWCYPIPRRNLAMAALVNAVGLLHLKCGKRVSPDDIIEVELTKGDLVLQSLIPKLFVDEFSLIFPKLYGVFLELRGSKVGLLRIQNDGNSQNDSARTGERADLPVDCQVKWTDEIERNFYETLPDFRSSLPSLSDEKTNEDPDSPKAEQTGVVIPDWQDDMSLPDGVLPVSSQFDGFMSEFIRFCRSCAFIDRGTAYCIDEFARTYFLKLLNSRNNRRRIARQFTAGVTDVNALPCICRFAAIIDANTIPLQSTTTSITPKPTPNFETRSSNMHSGPILKTMVACAKQQYEKEMKNVSQSKLDWKIYWAVYLCELCKVKALPVADILDILLKLSQYDVFTILPSAPEVLCTILEQCGRFLAGTYGADLRLSNLLTIIDRIRSRSRSIPARVDVSLEDQLQILGACCARMRGEITPLWDRLNKSGSSLKSALSPQILYARYLINDIAAQGLWTRNSTDRMNHQHVDRYLKIKKTDSGITPVGAASCAAQSPPTFAKVGLFGNQDPLPFDELVRRLKTLDLKDRKVVLTLMECCLDRNNYSPTNAHMVYFLAELANELPHFVGVCVDELIYRVVYCVSGKQQRLLEAHMVANFLNYKLIDTTVGLDIVAYLIGLAATPHGASHFRAIFDCVSTCDTVGDCKREYPFEIVKRLLHHPSGSCGFLDVIYYREIKEEFEEVKVVEVRSRLDTPLAQLMFAKKINHHLSTNNVSEDEEYFRYKLAIALLRNCGTSIVQRVYRPRLTFMIDILYYCISFALQTSLKKGRSLLSNNPNATSAAPQSDQTGSQQLNLRLDFEEMANHLDYPYTDLWDLTLACNNLAQFMKQIIKEIDENEADFQPLLGSEHSLLRGFKSSWANSLGVDSHETLIEATDNPLRIATTEEERSPTSAQSASKSDSSECTSSNLSDYEATLDNNLFDTELNLIINESLDNAKATAPRTTNLADLRIPPKLNIKSSACETKSFRLIIRQRAGGKQVFKPINVPFTASAASTKLNELGDANLDRQALKRFVLDRALNEETFRDIVDVSPTCNSDCLNGQQQYRPSEASALTRVMLYNNSNEHNTRRSTGVGGSLGKRAKRNKPARVRSRTTTTFLTTDSSDD